MLSGRHQAVRFRLWFMRNLLSAFALVWMLLCSCAIAASFGPRESILIFDGRHNNTSYRMDNSDTRLPWLVQAWIEDINEKHTDVFTAVPLVFRVEPSSTFSVRIVKKGVAPEDRETLFWVVSNSLPASERSKQNEGGDKINAQLSLAYRFKVPMIYRPAVLSGKSRQPEFLQWSIAASGKMSVYNPTPYVMQLNYVNIGGKIYQGKGVSWFILPEKSVTVDVGADIGDRIKYGVLNDYGAVREYEGVVR